MTTVESVELKLCHPEVLHGQQQWMSLQTTRMLSSRMGFVSIFQLWCNRNLASCFFLLDRPWRKKSAISVEALLGHRRLGKWWVKNPAPTGGSLHQAITSVGVFFWGGWGGKSNYRGGSMMPNILGIHRILRISEFVQYNFLYNLIIIVYYR